MGEPVWVFAQIFNLKSAFSQRLKSGPAAGGYAECRKVSQYMYVDPACNKETPVIAISRFVSVSCYLSYVKG
jgi:hypothetical protein